MYKFADRLDGISGSAIRQLFALLKDPEIISFGGGNPAPESFPAEEAGRIAEKALLTRAGTIMQYGGTAGMSDLIEQIIKIYERSGIAVKPSEVIVLSGSSQGIELMSKAFLNPGDAVLTESPSFLGALQTFNTYQAKLTGITLEEDGVNLEELENAIKRENPKFFYTIPTYQNPSGITTSQEKRKAIYDICKKYGVLILEDDPYRELSYDGQQLAPIKTYDDCGLVINLMSFSKVISPGIRVGAAIADEKVIAKFNILKQGMDVHTSNLSQVIAMEYVKSGKLYPHIKETCKMYKKKLDTMQEAISEHFPKEVKVTHPTGGLFIWAELPEHVDTTEVFKKAVEKKVAFIPGTSFFADGGHKNTMRLNFSMISEQKIKEGIARLGEVLKEFI